MPAENTIDVAAALRDAAYDGAIWSVNAAQLNINLMRLSRGARVPEHRNDDLDVLLVFLEGMGELTVDGVAQDIHAGVTVVIPAGVARALVCTTGPLVYVTCHRRRGGLMPTWPGEQQPIR